MGRTPGGIAGPGSKPYIKSQASLEQFVEGFRWQANAWDCEPSQIFNILQEFSTRHAEPSLALRLDVIHKIFPPALEGPSWSRAIRALAGKLPANYKLRYLRGSGESRWPQVEEVLKDDECSLPLISVSTNYWQEVSTRPAEGAGMDHALIVLGQSGSVVQVFDSYMAILHRSTRTKSEKGRLKMADGIVEVDQVKLIDYWEKAQIPRYHLWIQRAGRRGVQKRLDVTEEGT